MSENILGIDLGTNSIGLSLRNANKGNGIEDQIEYFTSIVFPSGVGKGKSGEFSYAAERTKHRSSRRLYQARRYRIWATLKLLIENDYCPLSMEDLEKWSRYDKAKGLKRRYPIHATLFEQWVRLDFNSDGKPDFSNPYELRALFMKEQFDFTNQINRYKLGRALYHIAQHRGFKSSKGETIKEQEQNEMEGIQDFDLSEALKKSEEKKSGKLSEYMKKHNLPTVGCAYAHLRKKGIRVRNSIYQAVRSQYKDEIKQIFDFQNGLDKNSDFYKKLMSEKKGEGTIFYKRPLRSQKGQVGYCTLEPNKPRCPISHPEFEKFRAWCLINNIRFGEDLKETLTLEQKKELFNERFLLARSSFKFEEIRKWIEKETFMHLDYKEKTINYKDKTNVSGCPISGRLKKLLGEDWEHWKYNPGVTKIIKQKKDGKYKERQVEVEYSAYDLWHICYSFEEPENVETFAKEKLHFNDAQTKQLVHIFFALQQGYSMLSIKAIKNINHFLEEGLIYSDAVLLAKLPDIFQDKWTNEKDVIVSQIGHIVENNRNQKLIFNIVNTLIANYKSLGYDDEIQINERFADHNLDYKLQPSDYHDVETATINAIGEKTWAKKSENQQKNILDQVATLYQNFFASRLRDYYKIPKVSDELGRFLYENYSYLQEKDLKRIYHPSMIELYAPAKDQKLEDGRWMKLLGSPVIGAFKNPMAMRVLHVLRKQINELLKASLINGEETRIVVETARELNDANMRWAIETYQREREAENKEYEAAIIELIKDSEFKGNAEPDKKEDKEKLRLWAELSNSEIVSKLDSKGKPMCNTEEQWKTYGKTTSKLLLELSKCKTDVVKKYKLWKEQGCRCLYTGKVISITNLFDSNAFDFEHTIPRSLSFDDSLENLTICDAHYNRTVKQNQLPTQLANYEKDANGYTAILPRLQPWMDKVERLKDNVNFWKAQSKRAQDKARKDHCIRQQHLWEMELKYWKAKVERFTMTEVTSGFRNNQLNDTRLITKYAYHYLKTVFNKVDVQKGKITSDFRKILGLQSTDEKKNRDKHSHHAIDATVLTMIPSAAQRDKMLELFYKIQEEEKEHKDTTVLKKELCKEIKKCNLPINTPYIAPFIENNILINHVSKDQTLTIAHKRKRIRGKIVPLRDADGKIIYEKNADGTIRKNTHGHPIPKAKEWITGDSIRGQLHKDSFFGAIKYPKTDENGKPVRKDGAFVYESGKDGQSIISMVMRVPITSFKKEEELKKIVDPSVRDSIERTIAKRKEDNKSFKTALEEPMWLLDKDGNEIKEDKNGMTISPIRHVRCRVAAGRGFFTKDKALEVKDQTYPSKFPYKNTYYAQNDINYLFLLYEGINRGKLVRQSRIVGLYEVSKILKTKEYKDFENELANEPYYKSFTEKNVEYNLSAIIKVGMRVILWKESPDELLDLFKEELYKRIYVVCKFNTTGADLVYLRHHTNASENIDLALVPNNLNCLIENRDFRINDLGIIEWL